MKAVAVASGVIFARELVNGSANVVNPLSLADAAVARGINRTGRGEGGMRVVEGEMRKSSTGDGPV